MHLRIALACLALLTVPAHADGMAFFVKNQHEGAAVAVELYGRLTVWPGNDQVFLLDPREKKSTPITCEVGETICWGEERSATGRSIDNDLSIEATNARSHSGGRVGDAGTYWGVGPDAAQRCDNCCVICTNKTTATVEIGP